MGAGNRQLIGLRHPVVIVHFRAPRGKTPHVHQESRSRIRIAAADSRKKSVVWVGPNNQGWFVFRLLRKRLVRLDGRSNRIIGNGDAASSACTGFSCNSDAGIRILRVSERLEKNESRRQGSAMHPEGEPRPDIGSVGRMFTGCQSNRVETWK